jgi:prolyl-tRNA editing enzyme YbaK/EbsC (Cys-tRNA(Pro) deacylase)
MAPEVRPHGDVPEPLEGGRTSLDRVKAALSALGVEDAAVAIFPEGTRTAADAAAAIGTTVGSIVKSMIFLAGEQPVLVLTSGPNRVDLEKVAQLVGRQVSRANANEVRQHTGFAIGGVPPVGHSTRLEAYVDRDLLQYDRVWAAAGTPNTVFPIDPHLLVRITNGRVADVAEST